MHQHIGSSQNIFNFYNSVLAFNQTWFWNVCVGSWFHLIGGGGVLCSREVDLPHWFLIILSKIDILK